MNVASDPENVTVHFQFVGRLRSHKPPALMLISLGGVFLVCTDGLYGLQLLCFRGLFPARLTLDVVITGNIPVLNFLALRHLFDIQTPLFMR